MDRALGLLSYALTMSVPIFTLPMLGNQLNHTELGKYFIIISLSTLLSVIVDFGFSISGLAESKSGMIESEVFTMKASRFTGLISSLFIAIVYSYFSGFEFYDIACVVAIALLMGYNNIWYFQIIKQLNIFYVSEIFGKIVFFGLFVLVQKHITSYRMVLFIYILGLIVSHVIIYSKLPVLYSIIRTKDYFESLKTIKVYGLITRVIINLYVNANTLLLNFFLPAYSIAGYGTAERIFRAISGAATPFYNNKIINLKDVRESDYELAIKKLSRDILYFFAFGSFAAFILIALTRFISSAIFKDTPSGFFENMRLLSLTIPFAICNGYVGLRWMILDGREKLFICLVSIAALINVLIVVSMVFLRQQYYGLGLLIGEAFLFFCLVVSISWRSNAGRNK